MNKKVTALTLTAPHALKLIKAAAAVTSRVQFTTHALMRMRQRKISTNQVLDVLRSGIIVEGPARSLKGNWEMAMERFVAGDNVGVVLAIEPNGVQDPVIIITTYLA